MTKITQNKAITPVRTEVVPNKGGRPLSVDLKRFNDVTQEYVKECTELKKIPFLTGLALKLGISKEAMNDYAKRPHYDKIIKSVDLLTETMVLDKGLTENKPVFPIFLLKAKFGYQEAAQRVDLTVNPGVVTLPHNPDKA